ncbi:MAG: hypothetical protein Ct9H300mP12_08790 [Acidimicrobiales bacterium]|nr:MAG: hypothetical protein Ct9H300mP12_08790 [Acidimicrobiales bacterium]
MPYLVGATGPGFDDIIKQPSDRVIESGDLLMFDTGSVFDGYSSDFDRYVAFGQADADAKRAYRTVWEATGALVSPQPSREPPPAIVASHGRSARRRWVARELGRTTRPRTGYAGHRVAFQSLQTTALCWRRGWS